MRAEVYDADAAVEAAEKAVGEAQKSYAAALAHAVAHEAPSSGQRRPRRAAGRAQRLCALAHRVISLQGSASVALGAQRTFARAKAVDDPATAGGRGMTAKLELEQRFKISK